VALEPKSVILGDGTNAPADLVVWLTGAAPPPVLAVSDLPVAPNGFFHVDATLQAVDGTPAWGAGDCIALTGHPDMPRAGVYAVRQSPVLAANVLAGRGVRHFTPQRSFLSLLNTADGRALLRWKAVVAHTRWAWWLKDRIDRRFMTLYSS
jgi:selenide,water dikinase